MSKITVSKTVIADIPFAEVVVNYYIDNNQPCLPEIGYLVTLPNHKTGVIISDPESITGLEYSIIIKPVRKIDSFGVILAGDRIIVYQPAYPETP